MCIMCMLVYVGASVSYTHTFQYQTHIHTLQHKSAAAWLKTLILHAQTHTHIARHINRNVVETYCICLHIHTYTHMIAVHINNSAAKSNHVYLNIHRYLHACMHAYTHIIAMHINRSAGESDHVYLNIHRYLRACTHTYTHCNGHEQERGRELPHILESWPERQMQIGGEELSTCVRVCMHACCTRATRCTESWLPDVLNPGQRGKCRSTCVRVCMHACCTRATGCTEYWPERQMQIGGE
jgi:hypothetical protein